MNNGYFILIVIVILIEIFHSKNVFIVNIFYILIFKIKDFHIFVWKIPKETIFWLFKKQNRKEK